MAFEGAAAESAPAESAPAAAPESQPSSQPQGQPGGEGGGAPPASPAEGGSSQEGGKPPAPTGWVPWAEHRATRSEAARLRRESQAIEQRYQDQIAQAQQENDARYAEYQQKVTDYDILQSVLQEHPDLAEAFYERVGQSGNGTVQAVLPPELAEKLAKVDRIENVLTQAERRQQMQMRDIRLRETETKLNGVVSRFLTDRKYASVDRIAPAAVNYVLWRVSQMEDPSMDDVPHLLTEYLLPFEQEWQTRQDSYRNGKFADGRLPASPGATNAAFRPATPGGANDVETSNALAEALKQRLGWGG